MSAIIVDKEKKREAIIIAALQVFAKKGFSKTTIRDIAEQAGIGKGTIYEYFSDKEEIIHSSFRYFIKIFETDMERILISESTGLEKLKNIVKPMIGIIESEKGELLELMFDFWAEGIRSHSKGHMLEEMQGFYVLYRKIFEDVLLEGVSDGSIRKNIDTSAIASLIVGLLDGLIVQWVLDKNFFKNFKIEKDIVELLVNGLEGSEK